MTLTLAAHRYSLCPCAGCRDYSRTPAPACLPRRAIIPTPFPWVRLGGDRVRHYPDGMVAALVAAVWPTIITTEEAS